MIDIRNILFAVFLVLLQAFVLNHIRLFGYAVPMLLIYWLLPTRRKTPGWKTLIGCFLVGMAGDICSNTPGVGAAALTFAGFVQPYVLSSFLTQDSDEGNVASIKTLGAEKYFIYAATLTAIYILAFFAIDAFNFYNFGRWLLTVFGSYALTLFLCIMIESARRR